MLDSEEDGQASAEEWSVHTLSLRIHPPTEEVVQKLKRLCGGGRVYPAGSGKRVVYTFENGQQLLPLREVVSHFSKAAHVYPPFLTVPISRVDLAPAFRPGSAGAPAPVS